MAETVETVETVEDSVQRAFDAWIETFTEIDDLGLDDAFKEGFLCGMEWWMPRFGL